MRIFLRGVVRIVILILGIITGAGFIIAIYNLGKDD